MKNAQDLADNHTDGEKKKSLIKSELEKVTKELAEQADRERLNVLIRKLKQ